MQNFANMITTQNTVSMDDFISSSQQNYDTKNIAEKGKDFLSVLNRNESNANNQNVQKNNKNYNGTQRNSENKQNQETNNAVSDDKKVISEDKNNKSTNETNGTKNIKQPDKNNENEIKNNTKEEKTESTNSQDKTIDEVKSEPVVKETQQTAQGENMQVLDTNTVIQDTVNKINNLIETSLDGQLNIQDVEQLKGALEEIQTKINNNELVVSEDTKQMVSDVLERLLTQNPQDLEVAELQKDLKQLAQDIKVNAFKLNSQVKMEEENSNPTKALEINIDETDTKITKETKKETSEEKTTQKTKDSQTTVVATKDTKETQEVAKNEIDIEQEILDEMDVKIEEVSDSSTNTNSQNQNYTSAQDEVIKLQIQNSDTENTTPITFTFDKTTVKNISAVNKPIQLEGMAKELNVNDILNQIGSKFEQLKDGSTTKITMTLRPNDLGRVTIELLSNANGISTNIIAQNSQVKELLDKNIDILKQQLAQQGINVQNVQVKTVEQNSQTGLNNSNSQRDNQQENQGQNQNTKENNQNQQHQKRETFKFNRSNIIENIDFENNVNNTTTSINTLRGKISYNL